MANDSFHHGVSIEEVTGGTRYLQTFRTGVIGMVGTAPEADPEVFPENIPVLVTNVQDIVGKAGDTGTLPEALTAIAAQGNALSIFVRVPEGQTPEETNSNVIGTVTDKQQRTGLQALLSSQSVTHVRPRILGAPGLDTKPVTNAMVSIAQQLRAFVYARCEGESVSEWLAYRKDFAARELMLIAGQFLSWSTKENKDKAIAAAAHALGLRAKIDATVGWNRSISNIAVNGVEGIDKDISWGLQDPNTDAGLLNEAGITTVINHNGFRFWGNRCCDDSGHFPFETSTRTAQIIADTIAENMFIEVDGVMRPQPVKDIVETVNAKLADWTRNGFLLGGECWIDPEENTAEKLKAGQVCFDYDYTDTPPMEHLQFRQRKTDKYFANFLQSVAQA